MFHWLYLLAFYESNGSASNSWHASTAKVLSTGIEGAIFGCCEDVDVEGLLLLYCKVLSENRRALHFIKNGFDLKKIKFEKHPTFLNQIALP